MWVLDYLEDIDSDMSVFHRVDDARTTLPAPLYFERAERLAAYPGVLRARVLDEQRRKGDDRNKVAVSDDFALTKLANEGWVEHNVEGAAP